MARSSSSVSRWLAPDSQDRARSSPRAERSVGQVRRVTWAGGGGDGPRGSLLRRLGLLCTPAGPLYTSLLRSAVLSSVAAAARAGLGVTCPPSVCSAGSPAAPGQAPRPAWTAPGRPLLALLSWVLSAEHKAGPRSLRHASRCGD